jgi:hypothetical protein
VTIVTDHSPQPLPLDESPGKARPEQMATSYNGPIGVAARMDGHLGRRVLRRRRAAARKQRPALPYGSNLEERSDKLLKRIRKAREAGDEHRARGLQRVFLASWEAKRAAALEAARKIKGLSDREGVADAVASWMAFSRRTVDEEIRVFAKRKRSGGVRLICDYGPEDKARQVQARMALEAVVDLRPEQYGVTGRGHP